VSLEDYRVASLRQWERSAEGWGRRREEVQRVAAPVSEWMVEAVAPRPGDVVLELAAGPGETGFLAAERIRPGGRLICSDFAAPMLDVARERAAQLGVQDVDFRVLNAESLDLDAASVDAVLCRWGYMLMADPGAALQETRRVLRPGGRLALAAWDDPAANPWVSVIAGAVRRELGAPEPDPRAPGMFSFAPPGRVADLLAEAGFAEVRVEPIELRQSFRSREHWWEVQLDLGRPLADLLDSASAEQARRIRAAVEAASEAFAQADGTLAFPARALVAAATA
jgi:ubiquinone/menaquinone biosynthesis C-methylase UbiE